MSSKLSIKVLLVDDHPFILEGLRSFLMKREDVELVGDAADGREAIEKARALQPSVIIMDVNMPVMNGLEATRRLRAVAPDVKVLILTLHNEKEFAARIIESGARGYVSKNCAPFELVRAIETVDRGETFFQPDAVKAFLNRYVENRGKPETLSEEQLSMREREVMIYVAEGFLNKEIADLLGVSVRTVEKHRERVMDKLHLHSRVELTKYAVANGMVQLNLKVDRTCI